MMQHKAYMLFWLGAWFATVPPVLALLYMIWKKI